MEIQIVNELKCLVLCFCFFDILSFLDVYLNAQHVQKSESGREQQGEKNLDPLSSANLRFRQTDEKKLVWKEIGNGIRIETKDWLFGVPHVWRQKGSNPVFIFQISYFGEHRIKPHTPYVLVVRDADAFHLLTSNGTEISGLDVITAGQIMGDLLPETSYLFSYFLDFSDPSRYGESFSICTDKINDREFDLAKGRVFEIYYDRTKEATIVNQYDVPLFDISNAEKDIKTFFRGNVSSDKAVYSEMKRWWETIKK
jgi:hypothetical protein